MKKWIACMALAMCGCGYDNFVGTWRGSVSGWDVTVRVDRQSDSAYSYSHSYAAVSGQISTDNSLCFTSAPMSGALYNNKDKTDVDIMSTGSGSNGAANTSIRIEGDFIGNTFLGFFTADSNYSGCKTARIPITLKRY
ncbi:hypothetical protein [Archangium sp.]|uniref:hypothetical protein n=1 Tax=Archangium sp. TaxID=1872627 RepID=UPI002D742922|nr:hypothetical protein [Archangium sp.]HYO53007.1 hypothetical protein [Archangium sp.]